MSSEKCRISKVNWTDGEGPISGVYGGGAGIGQSKTIARDPLSKQTLLQRIPYYIPQLRRISVVCDGWPSIDQLQTRLLLWQGLQNLLSEIPSYLPPSILGGVTHIPITKTNTAKTANPALRRNESFIISDVPNAPNDNKNTLRNAVAKYALRELFQNVCSFIAHTIRFLKNRVKPEPKDNGRRTSASIGRPSRLGQMTNDKWQAGEGRISSAYGDGGGIAPNQMKQLLPRISGLLSERTPLVNGGGDASSYAQDDQRFLLPRIGLLQRSISREELPFVYTSSLFGQIATLITSERIPSIRTNALPAMGSFINTSDTAPADNNNTPRLLSDTATKLRREALNGLFTSLTIRLLKNRVKLICDHQWLCIRDHLCEM